MTLNHFRTFVKVCEHLSMTAAAQELHISQPAISQTIRDMEEHYGVKLFERSGNRLIATPDAMRFREYVDALLVCQDNIESRHWQRDSVQTAALGLDTPSWDIFMPQLTERYAREIGTLRPVIYTNPTGVMMHACTTGELDIAIVTGELLPTAALRAIPLARDELVFVCRKDSRFVAAVEGDVLSVSPEELSLWPMLLPYKNSASRSTFNSAMAIHNLDYCQAGNFNNDALLLRAVELDMGVGVVSRHERVNKDGLVTFRIAGLDLTSDINLIHRRSPAISPEVREMRDFIADNFRMI